MKTTLKRMFLVVAVALLSSQMIEAATLYINNIKYTTTTSGATVAKYDSKITDGIYKGDIVIPDFIDDNGTQKPVIATGANAFKDCIEVTSVKLPASCVTIGRSSFSGCTALTNYPVGEAVTSLGTNAFENCSSITEAFLPAGITKAVSAAEFAGCTSLKKFTIKDADAETILGANAFTSTNQVGPTKIEEVYIGRNNSTQYGNPFAKMTSIKKVTFGDKVTSIPSSAFNYCSGITEVVISENSAMTEIGSSAFLSCSSLTSFTYPKGVKNVSAQTFMDCKNLTQVNLHSAIETIGNYAFSGCKLTETTTLPAGVTRIGNYAFNGAYTATNIALPASLTTLGERAFVNCKIENITMGANVATIGDAPFAGVALKTITVDAANATFKAENDILTSIDGKVAYALAPNSTALAAMTAFSNDAIEEILPYAFNNAPFVTMSLPNVTKVGNYAFQNTKVLESFTFKANTTVGTSVFDGSGIKSLTFEEGFKTIPASICKGCTSLTSVTLPNSLNVIMNDAFAGCTSLKHIEFGEYLNYLEAGAVPTTIENIVCKNVNVPIINENLFNAEQSAVVCKVAESAVADYKAAAGWNFLNIQGDASITGSKAPIGCPSGIYFATKSGELMFRDVDGKIEDTGIPAGEHAFQLGSAHNRVYVGYAGRRFTYSGTPANEGEGEVFYLNKSGDSFYRVTLVSNIGFHAFQDPFSLSVDAEGHKLLVADRNVGIHVIDTERPGLYGEQPFLLQNNWLPYYGNGIAYGAIGCGIYKLSDGTYWMGKKFNGNGIFRFKESDIVVGAAGELPYPILFNGTTMTTFYIDEANGYMYAYLQTGGGVTPGVYRISMADILANEGNCTFKDHAVLVDDAPVQSEGSAPSELTGITQISGNGETIYWSYIAPQSDETKITTEVVYDPTNPLHKSGIKSISAKGGNPEVVYAVPDIEAYGCVAATYVEPTGVSSSLADNAQKCTVKGNVVTMHANAMVTIVSVNGSVMGRTFVAAEGQVSVEGLASGLYIIHVAYENGTKDVVKVIRK